jgi:hypothetical protein
MPQQGQMQQPGMQRNYDAPPKGQSVFYLYCRTGPGKQWYPVSAMKGDRQSKSLVNAWLGAPLGKDVFKGRLDGSMAKSIFDSERRLSSMAMEQYSVLKKFPKLQWGYKIVDQDVMVKERDGEIEKQKILQVTRDMAEDKGLVGKAQDAMTMATASLPEPLKNIKLPEMPKLR